MGKPATPDTTYYAKPATKMASQAKESAAPPAPPLRGAAALSNPRFNKARPTMEVLFHYFSQHRI